MSDMSEEQEEYEADDLDRKWWFVRGMRNVYDPGTTPLERYRRGLMGPVAPLYRYDVLWLYEMCMRIRYLFGDSPYATASPGYRLKDLKDNAYGVGTDPAGLTYSRISALDFVLANSYTTGGVVVGHTTVYDLLSRCVSALSSFVNGTALLIDPDYGDLGFAEQDFENRVLKFRADLSGYVGISSLAVDSSELARPRNFTFSSEPYRKLDRLRFAEPAEAQATLRDQDADPGEPTTDFTVKRPPYLKWVGPPVPENMYVTFKSKSEDLTVPDRMLSQRAVSYGSVNSFSLNLLHYPVFAYLDEDELALDLVVDYRYAHYRDLSENLFGFDPPPFAVCPHDPGVIELPGEDSYDVPDWWARTGIPFYIAPLAGFTVSPPAGWLDAWPEQFSSVVNAMHVPGLGGPLDLVMRKGSRYESGPMDFTENWSDTSGPAPGSDYSTFPRAGMRLSPLYSAYVAYICGILDSVVTKRAVFRPSHGDAVARFRFSVESKSTYENDWENGSTSRYYVRDILKEAQGDFVVPVNLQSQNTRAFYLLSGGPFHDGAPVGLRHIGSELDFPAGANFGTPPAGGTSSVYTNSVSVEYPGTGIDDYSRGCEMSFVARWSATTSFDVRLVNGAAIGEEYGDRGFAYGGWSGKTVMQSRYDTEDSPTVVESPYGEQFPSIPPGFMERPDLAFVPEGMDRFYDVGNMRAYAFVESYCHPVVMHKASASGSVDNTVSDVPASHRVDAASAKACRLVQVSAGSSGRFRFDPASGAAEVCKLAEDEIGAESALVPLSGAADVKETHKDGKVDVKASSDIESLNSNLLGASFSGLLYGTPVFNTFESGCDSSSDVTQMFVTLGLSEEAVFGFSHDCPAFDPVTSE